MAESPVRWQDGYISVFITIVEILLSTGGATSSDVVAQGLNEDRKPLGKCWMNRYVLNC